jgi:hypothetical protein
VQVDLGRFCRFVPQPESDHAEVDAAMKQGHSGGVAESVRSNLLGNKRRAVAPGCLDVAGYEPLHCVGTEWAATRGWKQRGFGPTRLPRKPLLQDGGHVRAQWRAAQFPALAQTADVSAGSDLHIFTLQGRNLAVTKPGLNCQ